MNQNAGLEQQRQLQMQQQQQPYVPRPAQPYSQGGQMPFQPPQAPYKGTLAPGTKVKVGAITVTVKRYLSEGGFAHVYLVTTAQPIPMPSSITGTVGASAAASAQSTRGETTHVLKRMAVPDKEALADVRREVEVHKLLRNQANIVHFIEASATALQGGGYEIFILMEFCSRGGIIDLMNARLRDRLREDEVLKIFGDVCAGVAVMHHQDPPLMHRDLKVENILMSPSIGPDAIPGSRSASSNLKATFKLCDFGSAAPVLSRRAPKSMDEVKRVEADLNKHTTLQYRAPEMVDVYQRRVIDEKADIWALGVFLYKLCYYTTPFEENGGGPLAILNVQYRFPPQPVYSQKLKELIGSLLVEQSMQRPTIDQVIINVHRILGTRPPSTAVHYAQLALSGKIVEPLPAVSGAGGAGRSSDGIDVVKLASGQIRGHETASPRSGEADLISIGPAQREREDAEARQLAKQTEKITPMRRGRPTKQGAAVEPPSSSSSSTMLDAVTSSSPGRGPERSAREGLRAAASAVDQRASPSQARSAPSANGFDDTFSPSSSDSPSASTVPSVAAASRSPPLSGTPTPAPSFSMSNTPAPPASLPPRPRESGGSPAPNLSRPFKGVSPGPIAGSLAPSPSPLRHSPALPGFSATNSPAPSPALGQNGAGIGSTQAKRMKSRFNNDDGAAGRFPSVEELDARYASRSPIASPPASTVSAAPHKASSFQIPGLSSRASVGALASRINLANTVDTPQSLFTGQLQQSSASTLTPAAAAAATATGSIHRRWQPPTSAVAVTGDISMAPVASPTPTKPPGFKASNLSSIPAAGNHAACEQKIRASQPSYRRSGLSPQAAAPSSPSKGDIEKARDWLTGDGSDDDAETRTTYRAASTHSDRADVIPHGDGDGAKGSEAAAAAQQQHQQDAAHRSAARYGSAANGESRGGGSAAREVVSSDDEAEEPEDPDARRPTGPPTGPSTRTDRPWSVSSAAGKMNEAAAAAKASRPGSGSAHSSVQTARAQPGRSKAPSWLAGAQDDHGDHQALEKLDTERLGGDLVSPMPQPSRQSSLASVASPTRSELAANEKLDDAARAAEKKLEELMRGPEAIPRSSSPEKERVASAEGIRTTPHPLPSRVQAPAWDEEEDEMKVLPQPQLQAASAHRRTDTGNLVDLSEADNDDDRDRSPPRADAAGASNGPTSQQRWPYNLMDEEPEGVASTAMQHEIVGGASRDLKSLPRLQADVAGSAKRYADAATSPHKADPLDHQPTTTMILRDEAASGGPDAVRQHDDGPAFIAIAQRIRASESKRLLDGARAGEEGSQGGAAASAQSNGVVVNGTAAKLGNGSFAPSRASAVDTSSWKSAQPTVKPGFVRQRQQSLVGDRGDARSPSSSAGPGLGSAKEAAVGVAPRLTCDNPPRIIMPKPTAVRPVNSSLGRSGGASTSDGGPSKSAGGLKPWEREAAAAAEISKTGLVRSSGLRGPANADSSDHVEEGSEGASRGETTDGFSGVSSLISRWQQNVKTQAPGWGRVGGASASSEEDTYRRSNLAGQGRGLGPNVAGQAAASVQSRKADASET